MPPGYHNYNDTPDGTISNMIVDTLDYKMLKVIIWEKSVVEQLGIVYDDYIFHKVFDKNGLMFNLNAKGLRLLKKVQDILVEQYYTWAGTAMVDLNLENQVKYIIPHIKEIYLNYVDDIIYPNK